MLKNRKVLKRWAPADWERLIFDRITDVKVRIQVANIIWWDFGGGYMHDEHPGWTAFRNRWVDGRRIEQQHISKVRSALHKVGYGNVARRANVGSCGWRPDPAITDNLEPVPTDAPAGQVEYQLEFPFGMLIAGVS